MQTTLIINSIVCVIGAIVGAMLAIASMISIANMEVPWAGALLVAAILVPVIFVVSGIGAWVANAYGSSAIAIGLIVLPWIYGAIFVMTMLMSFKS